MQGTKHRPLRLACILLASAIACLTAQAAPTDDVAHADLVLSVAGPEGRPLPSALVYGYCAQYGLLWPRFTHDQFNKPWEKPPRAVSGPDGTVQARTPRGRWSFVAVGSRRADGPAPFTVICAETKDADVDQNLAIALSPGVTHEISPADTDMGDIVLTDVLYRHPKSGVWLSTPLDGTPPPPWRFACGPRIRTVLTLHAPGRRAHYVTSLTLPATGPAVTAAFQRATLAKIALVRRSPSVRPVQFRWERDVPGFEGALDVRDAEAVYLPPGEYRLSYDCELDDGTLLRFGPGLFDLAPGRTVDFLFGDGYRAAVQEQRTASGKFIGMLMAVDAQDLLSWRWTRPDGERPAMKGELLVSPGDPIPVECKYDHPHYWNQFHVPGDRTTQAAEAKARTWRLDTPLTDLVGDRFPKTPRTRLKTPYFHIDAVAPAAVAVRHFLQQADRRALAIQEVCGHAKKRNTLLRLEPQIKASATHNASRLSLSIHRLQSPAPAQNHTFVHELTHNFGYRHGPLMELVVELSRDNGGPQMTAQLAKWIFFDRMNGRKTPERVTKRWRDSGRDAPLGLYFYFRNKRGTHFITFLSNHTRAVLVDAAKRDIPERTARIALTSAAMRRDVRPLWHAYGYKTDPDAYDAAMRLVKARVTEK